MAKEIASVLFTVLTLVTLFQSPALAVTIVTYQKTIVLDPGHGGSDPGIQTKAGLHESHITFELAQLTALELADNFQVRLTRNLNETKSSEDRTAFANRNRADFFISLHLHQASPGKGFIFFFDTSDKTDPPHWQTQAQATRSQAKKMASTLAGSFQKSGNRQTRISPAPLISLEGVLMPGILTEPFSITQVPALPQDRKKFLLPYARSLALAVKTHFPTQ